MQDLRKKKSVSDGVLPPRFVGGRDPKRVACGGQKQAAKETPERPVGAETFGDGFGHAAEAPNVGGQDDGVKLLERNGCWELGRKPATSKPKAIQVRAITNGPGGIGGYLKVRQCSPDGKKARDREECDLLEIDEALTATNMDGELASKMDLALSKLAKLDKLDIIESRLDYVVASIASIEETVRRLDSNVEN
ncbi:hypothetical protein ACROYT_G010927 [Oculina patagonica]